ncbi:hypothetical protein HPB49_006033 [Dermacentor silvarum]|uniref:Uncharacterized protein n=1 Tax=Dermacentor silvarum TaxID=543639 RepID=A0ACB8DWE0_DERSI|nr:hypothetical protein HPB49_006033 [Dermacentor silvarum]
MVPLCITQVDEASGATCTYAEFERQCLGVAAAMHYLGFRPGSVAAIASANSLDMVVALFATVFGGGRLTFIKTNLTESYGSVGRWRGRALLRLCAPTGLEGSG